MPPFYSFSRGHPVLDIHARSPIEHIIGGPTSTLISDQHLRATKVTKPPSFKSMKEILCPLTIDHRGCLVLRSYINHAKYGELLVTKFDPKDVSLEGLIEGSWGRSLGWRWRIGLVIPLTSYAVKLASHLQDNFWGTTAGEKFCQLLVVRVSQVTMKSLHSPRTASPLFSVKSWTMPLIWAFSSLTAPMKSVITGAHQREDKPLTQQKVQADNLQGIGFYVQVQELNLPTSNVGDHQGIVDSSRCRGTAWWSRWLLVSWPTSKVHQCPDSDCRTDTGQT